MVSRFARGLKIVEHPSPRPKCFGLPENLCCHYLIDWSQVRVEFTENMYCDRH